MIATSHGPIYKRPQMIIEAYREWTSGPAKNLVVIPYISMHDSTRLMVTHFVEACTERGIQAEQFNLADGDIGKLAMFLSMRQRSCLVLRLSWAGRIQKLHMQPC